MSRQWLRLVGRLSLAIFLIANGPVNVVTLACLLPSTQAETLPGSDPRSACCREAPSGCCCATGGERCGHGRRVQADEGIAGPGRTAAAGHSSRPPCPVRPDCPNCPAGCCGLCAAKVPCCLSALQPVQGPAPCLGASSAEHAVAVPSILPDERFHPPRA